MKPASAKHVAVFTPSAWRMMARVRQPELARGVTAEEGFEGAVRMILQQTCERRSDGCEILAVCPGAREEDRKRRFVVVFVRSSRRGHGRLYARRSARNPFLQGFRGYVDAVGSLKKRVCSLSRQVKQPRAITFRQGRIGNA